MRFKKLKIFVGISLVLFILVVGNILAFGLLKKYDNESDDSKTVVPIYINKSTLPSSNSQQQITNTSTQTPSNPSSSGTSTTVVQQTTRTRAS